MAETVSMRIPIEAREKLREYSRKEGKTINQILLNLIAEHEDKLFWDQAHEAARLLKNAKDAWTEFQDELKLWDTALNDGLEDAPWYEEERLTCMLLHPDAESIIHECLSEMRIESDVRLGRTSNRKLLVLWSSPAIPDLELAIAHRLRSDQLPFANIELVPLLSWRTSAAK